jgi:hypothetical protein
MSKKNSIKEMLKDFDVSDEDELLEKLIRESKTIPCSICHKEKEIEELRFIDSEPICLNCL